MLGGFGCLVAWPASALPSLVTILTPSLGLYPSSCSFGVKTRGVLEWSSALFVLGPSASLVVLVAMMLLLASSCRQQLLPPCLAPGGLRAPEAWSALAALEVVGMAPPPVPVTWRLALFCFGAEAAAIAQRIYTLYIFASLKMEYWYSVPMAASAPPEALVRF